MGTQSPHKAYKNSPSSAAGYKSDVWSCDLRAVGLCLTVAAGRCCCCCCSWWDVVEPVSGTLTDWFDFLTQLLAFDVSDSCSWECALVSVFWFQWIQSRSRQERLRQPSAADISQMSTQTSDGSPLVRRPRCWCRTDFRGLGQLFTFVLGDPRCSSRPAGENRLPDRK